MLEALARLEPLMDDPPTRFELLTAAALAWFADEAVDVAVVEVGLGGRWDCTNVVDAEVAVLTNVSFDHTEVLGPTLEDIARDKSGIFKTGSRVVIGESDPTLVAQLRRAADAAGAAEVWVRGNDFACTSNRLAVGGRLIDVRTPGAAYGELLVPLHGAHQGDNASAALAAVEAFFGSPLHEDVVEEAFASVQVPGRLEVVGRHPLVVVDGAHNVAGMLVLARSLVEEFAVDGEAQAVVGMLTRAAIRWPCWRPCSPPASGRWWPAPPTPPGPCRPRWWPRQPRDWAWRPSVAGSPGRGRAAGPGPGRARRPRRGVRVPVRGGRGPPAAGPRRRLTAVGSGPGAARAGASASLPRSWDELLSSASPTPSNAAWWARSSAGSSARA